MALNGARTDAQIEAHRQRIADDGYTIVENAIDARLVAELRAALDELEARRGLQYAKTGFEGRRTLRVYNLLAHGTAFQQVPVHVNALPVAEAVLDDGLQLSSLSAIVLGPGQDAQPIHADSQLIPLPRPHPTISLNAMWALSDFTAANGATRLVPSSHRFDHAPAYDGRYDTVAAEMAAGSVMFFDSALWHGGGANRTDRRRYGIACYYCAGWVRQQENQQLGIPLELARTFPRRLKQLCGYGVYRGIYGHVENRDPIELLGETSDGMMVWEASDKAAAAVKPPAATPARPET